MNTPNFDNVILSKSAWDGMKDKIQIADQPLSLLGGVKIVTSNFVPENMMLLRQGDKVVAIVQIGNEAQQSVRPTLLESADLQESSTPEHLATSQADTT